MAKAASAANEALAVDPTDVAMRMQTHRRKREQRTRRLAVAGGLAAAVVVATAAAAWLEPTWRLLGSPHVQLAERAVATPPATRRDEAREAMAPPALTFYAGICGWTLARAHARSGDPIAIAEYLGGGEEFDRSITGFSERYANQNEQDYQQFLKAIKSGRLQATEGV